MYSDTITLFNYHKGSNLWYSTVIYNTDVDAISAATKSTHDVQNGDTVTIIVPSLDGLSVLTSAGRKSYRAPKAYAACDNPAGCITFGAGMDFLICGDFAMDPQSEDDYESGFYNAMNEANDNVYLITSASFFSLLPHFEIGGR